ncbi:hypothetical protein [Streptomyces sp. NBC_01235]|uniref:hypothetical protein n=1 Tax=Streptomyces sp. NBC_01235 TaxID=2903788 RepID=UPI002E11D2D2|nr:hypothetical protein OG289_42160 [Streptomyces sp. NBC_01235]
MAGSFRIAEGYVEVTADESAYDRAMDRLKSKRNQVGVRIQLDDRAAKTDLDRFLRDRTLGVKLKVDETALSRLRLRDIEVGIIPKISDAAYRIAQNKLDRLTADRYVNIRASMDTRVAADDLALLTRRRTVRVDVDVNRSALTILTGLGGAGGGVGLLSARFAGLAAAALSALPAVASLAGSVAQMGPAAALAVPALGGLVTAVATLAVGLHGVGDAFQAAGAKSGQSGASAVAAARAVAQAQIQVIRASRALKEAQTDAARQIADAQGRVKDAAEDVRDAKVKAAADRQAALRRVADAERALTDAVNDARHAEEDLTTARKEAAQQLEDLNNRLVDAQLDQRQAVLDVQDAEKQLAAVKAKGAAASAADIEEAQLGYDRAVQRLREQQTETARLTEQTAAANKAGVAGSDTVVKAQEKVADSQRTVGDRTRDVRDAQAEAAKTAKDGAEAVRDAQEKLAQAQQGVADAQVAAARQVRAATEAVADAQRAAAAAQEKGAAATDKYADAMAKLSPNARAFVKAVRAMGPAFSSLRMEVQDRLFRGLGTSFTRMATASLPALRVGLGGMADVLNGMGRGLMDTFTRLADQGLLKRMFDGFNNGMKPLVNIPGQLGQAFVQLGIAAAPALERITKGMAGVADRVSAKLTAAFEDGRLEKAINRGIDVAKRFGRLLGDIFGSLGNIMRAAATGGGDALTTLGDAFRELRRITALPEMQSGLASIFRALHEIASTLIVVVGAALQAVIPMVKPFAEAFAGLAAAVKGPLMTFFKFVGEHSTLFGSLATGVLAIVTAMKAWALATGLVTAAQGLLTAATTALSAAWAANPIGVVVLALVGLGAALVYAWNQSETFRSIVIGVWDAVKGAFAATADWINKWVIQPFKHLYDVLVGHSIIPDLVRAIVSWFTSLWTKTKEIFTSLKNWLVSTWNGIWSSFTTRWNSFWSGLRTSLNNAWATVKSQFTSLKTSLTNTWSSMWSGITSKVTSVFSTISGKIASFKSGMSNAFSLLKTGLGTIWDGVRSKISAPVKWVVDHVYNQGIRKMWNSIAGKISSKITLPAVPLNFNTGGVVPGSGNTDTVPAMLTPGERILSKQQVTKLGGHRGIDAMLGQDTPTKTGGNPSRQEERQRYQGGTQHFASGGIIGKVTGAVSGAVSSAASWAKDLVIGGLKSAAQKALTALVRPLINQIPGSGIGGLMKGLANKAVDGMLGWFGNEDKKAVGGPAVQKALSWVKTQNGLPYQWAGNGNPSWDCSGLMSAIESVIRGERPHRRWATGSFVGNSGPSGWVRNLNSPFMIGITNAGVGHTAGTLAGMNVESSGGAGVHMGKSARGYNDPMFTSRWGFAPAAKYDSGGLLQPGATLAINKTRKPEAVLTAEEHEAFRSIVTGLSSADFGGSTVNVSVEVKSMTVPSPAEVRRFAEAIADPVKEAIRKSDRSRA